MPAGGRSGFYWVLRKLREDGLVVERRKRYYRGMPRTGAHGVRQASFCVTNGTALLPRIDTAAPVNVTRYPSAA